MTNLVPIGRALISVSDKTGLLDFAAALAARGVEIVSTGGTRAALVAAGIPVVDVAEVTGFPEVMDGRIKTLHPNVHGGLLGVRNAPEHAAAMAAHGIAGIDLLVVNLHPFEATVAKAKQFADDGDLRFAAELAGHAVFAAPDHAGAKELLAQVFTTLGYGAECATWRNNFLVGADELGGQVHAAPINAAGVASALTVTQLFDSLAIRLDGPRAWDLSSSIRWHFTDLDETYRMELSNGVLIHHPTRRQDPADLVVTLTKRDLLGLLTGASADGVGLEGDTSVIGTIIGLIDNPDPGFAIVTP